MLTPAYANLWFHFYPIGNTPAVSLTQGLPPERKADILLLGCGDPRNILFTTYCDTPRPMDITCCDIEPTIIARNIILLTLILDDPDGQKSLNNWDIFYHVFLNRACHDRLLAQVKKLHTLATTLNAWREGAYGKLIRFCDKGTFTRVSGAWAFYISAATEKQFWMKKTFKEAIDARQRVEGEAQFSATGLRSATPTGALAAFDLNKLHQHFWQHGSLHLDYETRSQATFANPMFVSPDATVKLHYGTDPLFGYHLSATYLPFTSNSSLPQGGLSKPKLSDIVTAAQGEFSNWSKTFRRQAEHDLTLRFFSGDALPFCHTLQHRRATGSATTAFHYRSRHETMEPLVLVEDDYNGSAPVCFNVIDTSNLLDHMRGLNLLVATSPLLDGDVSSSLYTETVIQREANSQQEHLDKLVGGHLATTSLLLALFPVEYWTNTGYSSVGDEQLMMDAFKDRRVEAEQRERRQIYSRITWKRPPFSSGTRLDPLHIDAVELAALLYQIYIDIFPLERVGKWTANPTRESLQDVSLPFYARPGFMALLMLVKRRVVTDWASAMDKLLSHIESDCSMPMGRHYLQELYLYMHLLGLHSVDTFNDFSSFHTMPGSEPSSSPGLAGWQDMPPSVCITLKVARTAVSPLTNPPAHEIGTVPVQAVMRSSPASPMAWENNFSAVQLSFGELSTSGSRFTNSFAVSIREDLQGWHGDCALYVSFRVPSWTLLLDPQATIVSFGAQNSPVAVQTFVLRLRNLDFDLTVFKTMIGDTDNVYITRELPNLTAMMVIPGFAEDTFASPGQSDSGITTTTTAHVDHSTSRITFLSVRKDVLSGELSTSLSNGAKVQTTSITPCTFTVTVDTTLLTFTFPVPVFANTVRTRVARASHYIELIAVIIANPAAHPSATFTAPLYFPPPSANTTPTTATTTTITTTPTTKKNNHKPKHPTRAPIPISYATPYTTLSAHPRLTIPLPPAPPTADGAAPIPFLPMHLNQMFSRRESRLRARHPSAAPPAERARVNFKESIYTLVLQVAGLTSVRDGGGGGGRRGRGRGGGRAERVFALRDVNASTPGDLLVFVSALRMDLARRAVVLDCGVLAVTERVFQRMGGYLGKLMGLGSGGGVVVVVVDADEMRLWREVLPAWVERCRGGLWAHREGCEYYCAKEGVWKAPVSVEMGEEVVCGCGKGVFPQGWGTDIPLWAMFEKHCVRAAISPLFASALAEDAVPDFKVMAAAGGEAAGEEEKDSVSACRNCGREKSELDEDLKSCGQCRKVKYCGRACQRADWKRHKQVCTPKK